jgi:uncharacterized protein YbbC (DUF1343 family)/CubicO group peptidase (beta-lactamase class C family)
MRNGGNMRAAWVALFVLSLLVFTPLASEAARVPPRDPVELGPISAIVEKAIASGQMPGVVVLVGNSDGVLYREAFGQRSLVPEERPMTPDTIFDISSLTKVVATTAAVMQLVEKGKLSLDKTVVTYWPLFRRHGKERITVRQLLTHYSGLRPDLDMRHKWSGRAETLRRIIAEKPLSPPGRRFIYSDINFIILGELVQRISGQPLDVYCARNIFEPLGMKDTSFNPGASLRDRIAPTELVSGSKELLIHGEVHDPTARRMAGVAGHAGLFSTADDLSLFARMILNGGRAGDVRILRASSVERMTTKQSPSQGSAVRGLGWDIDSPFSSCRGSFFPVGSFGHTGFTGTSLWIDPGSKTYVIILASRLHPYGKGNAGPLRSEIATAVAAQFGRGSAGYGQPVIYTPESDVVVMNGHQGVTARDGKVRTGIDVLKSEDFEMLKGLSVGLITNHSGIDSEGKRTIDLLYHAPGVKLKAIFSPEHGLHGKEDKKVSSGVDPVTGLPVYSLYGDVKRPTAKMLEGLDAIVFDLQDAGTRFYTYISTLGYAMEAAAGKGLSFYVFDRPNPIDASIVQGFVPDDDQRSFTSYFPVPVRHGMTVGELAEMFNAEKKLGLDLRVVKMRGYERSEWYDETGLLWVNPSPNIRSLNQAALYPGVALVEGSNVSVGRGTETPFELLGAPWISGRELAVYLNKRDIKGVRFIASDFRPSESHYRNVTCHGVRIVLLNRQELDAPLLGIEVISALHRLYPGDFLVEKTKGLIASRRTFEAIREKKDPAVIVDQWQDQLRAFLEVRERYLLYR